MELRGQHHNIAAHAPSGIPRAKELRRGCCPHIVTVPSNCALAESSSALPNRESRRLPRHNHALVQKLRHNRASAAAPGLPSKCGHIRLKEDGYGRDTQKFDHDFREGAVRLVREPGKPIARVARDLGINEGTLGNWCECR